MRSRFKLAVLTIVAACSLLACGQKHSILGEWTIDGGPVPMTQTFEADGTSVLVTHIPSSTIEMTVTSTYALDGDKLSGKGVSITIKGADKATEAAMRAATDKELGKEASTKIEWISNDEFKTDYQGMKVTYRRKK